MPWLSSRSSCSAAPSAVRASSRVRPACSGSDVPQLQGDGHGRQHREETQLHRPQRPAEGIIDQPERTHRGRRPPHHSTGATARLHGRLARRHRWAITPRLVSNSTTPIPRAPFRNPSARAASGSSKTRLSTHAHSGCWNGTDAATTTVVSR
jgi:hypothetical protein